MNMEEEFVLLKWNTHQLAFFNTLSTLRDKQVYTDVTLSCGDQFYPAHRLVLSACSTFLAKTLEVTSCKAPVILLHGLDQNTLEQLLMFMYDGQVTIGRNELPKLLKAAKWLEIEGLDSDLDKYKINDAQFDNQNSSEQSDSSHLETWRQLLSPIVGSNSDAEVVKNPVNFYQQITNELDENEHADDQRLDASEIETDTAEENESQDNICSSNFDSVQVDENSTHEEGNNSCYISPETENNDSNSFHGWMDNEIDTKHHLRRLIENSYRLSTTETNHITSPSVPDEPIEMTQENNVPGMNKRSLKCKHCRKSFGIRKNLAKHLRTYHNENESYCFTCQTKYTNKREFLRHMKLHKAQKLHYCNFCDFVSHSLTGLKKHIAVQHKSSTISAKTLSKAELKDEAKQKIINIKEELQFSDKHQCPTCNKKIPNAAKLQEHLDEGCKGINKSEMGYHCPLCNYVSNRYRSVEDHVPCHTGVYPYNCSFCSFKAIRKHNLESHMVKRHPKI